MSTAFSRIRNLWTDTLGLTGLILRKSKRSNARNDPSLTAADGEPDDTIDAEPNASVRLVGDASNPDRAFAVRVGGVWYYAQLSAAADTALIDAHLNGGASKHDATEIDFELADGSKKQVATGSDTVEAAISDIDAAFGANVSTLTTTTKTLVGGLNEVDANADAALAQANQASEHMVPMAVLGTWAVDGDGARTNGGGLVGVTPTLMSLAGSQTKRADGGTIVDLNEADAGYTALYQLYPDAPANNDALYFGYSTKFPELAFNIGTAMASTGAWAMWEYWNGATWAALSVRDRTGADTTGARPFEQDGTIQFVPPTNWAQSDVDGVTAFWVRCRVNTVANIGVVDGTLDTVYPERVIPDGGSGYVSRQTGTITTLRLVDNASTLHTTADVKFILMNYTTGAHSGELIFEMDKRSQRWTGLSLAVTAGDVLGVLVTQEDGTNEPSGVMLELGQTVS